MTEYIKETIDRGQQAEEFLRFIEDHPYFRNMIAERKGYLREAIMALRPEQRDEFYSLKFQLEMLDFPLEQAEADAKMGVRLKDKVNVPKQEGIL